MLRDSDSVLCREVASKVTQVEFVCMFLPMLDISFAHAWDSAYKHSPVDFVLHGNARADVQQLTRVVFVSIERHLTIEKRVALNTLPLLLEVLFQQLLDGPFRPKRVRVHVRVLQPGQIQRQKPIGGGH